MINRQEIKGWLQAWYEGKLPLDAPLDEDSYMARVADHGVDLQPQLRAAFELREAGVWDNDTYQVVRATLEDEYNPETPEYGDRTVSATFDPWAPSLQSRPLPEGWSLDGQGNLVCTDPEKSGMTGRVPTAETVSQSVTKFADPVRSKGGRFLPHVAELWYYHPETGEVRRQVYTAKGAIAQAWQRARHIRAQWLALGIKDACVWVKYRSGELQGNRWVFLSDATGIMATPQEAVRLEAQAKGWGVKAKVGEYQCQTKVGHVRAMLEQNRTLASCNCDLCVIDVPSVEPDDPREIVYSITMQSGARRMVPIVPLSDEKDKCGKVTLAGHRKRAYRLLLEAPSAGADGPRTIKYVTYGGEDEMPQIHVIGRDEAIKWVEDKAEPEDEVLVELHRAFTDGEIDDDEYVAKRGRRLMKIDPPDPYRRGPTMHNPATRVDYVRGRHYWGKASNSNGPGARWVGGMSAFEAQLYNL